MFCDCSLCSTSYWWNRLAGGEWFFSNHNHTVEVWIWVTWLGWNHNCLGTRLGTRLEWKDLRLTCDLQKNDLDPPYMSSQISIPINEITTQKKIQHWKNMTQGNCITKVCLENLCFFFSHQWSSSLIVIYAIVRVWCTQPLQVSVWGCGSSPRCSRSKSMHKRTMGVRYVTILQLNISGFHIFQLWSRHSRWASRWDSVRGKAMTSYCWTSQMFPDTTKCFPTYE